MRFLWRLLLLALLLACEQREPPSSLSTSKVRGAKQEHDSNPSEQLAVAAPRASASATPPPQPYQDWRTRCESEGADRWCEKDSDCENVSHPSPKPLRCVEVWWSRDAKVCSPGWSNRRERKWRRARLREIVRQQYFQEAVLCAEWERPIERQSWECQRARKRGQTLTRFLWVVYERETTGRPWKRHRRDGDVALAETDWFRQGHRYGWWLPERQPCRDVPAASDDPPKLRACRRRAPSRAYQQTQRWGFGLGPYGQSAPLAVFAWDHMAPPEVLCGEVEPTEAYLRAARRSWRKLRGGVPCGDVTHRPDPITWEMVHRAVSGGKLCPAPGPSVRFRRRARRHELDPDQPVTLEMLGDPIPRDTQNQRAQALMAELDASHPFPAGAPS